MTELVEADAPEDQHTRPRAVDPGRRIAVFSAVSGIGLLALRHPLAAGIGRLLPGRGQISSSGTGIEPFASVAPQIIQRSGIVLLIVAGVAWVGSRWSSPPIAATRRRAAAALAVVVLVTALWYGWLAEPHNGFATNARFHWVDYLTWDADNFGYAAGRLPHMLFYERPYLWQAINAGLVAFLCFVMGRQLGYSRGVSTALAVVPAICGNLLLFADSAEDVLLNTALLFLVIVAALHRSPAIVGVVLGIVTFGRPSFMILIACFVVAEIMMSVRRGTGVRGTDWRYAGTGAGVGLGVIVAGQLVFAVLGERYLFVGGQFLRQDTLDQWVARPVEGFTVSPFSGVYFLHLLWVAPLVLLVGAIVATITATGQTRHVEAAIYMGGLFVIGHVLVHEAKPLAYYNGRYLAYVFPFLLFMASTLIGHSGFPERRIVKWSAISLLVLGTAVFPADPVGTKRFVEQRPETTLLQSHDELRHLADGASVFLDFGDVLSRNYLSYVLRKDIRTVQLVDESNELPRDEAFGPDGGRTGADIVISLREDPWTTAVPTLEVGEFVVFEVERRPTTDPDRANP